MNGPSVTPAARIVLAEAGGCSCWPLAGIFGVAPHFSYQAKTSEYQAFFSSSDMARPSGVSMIRMTYFTVVSFALDDIFHSVPRTGRPGFRHRCRLRWQLAGGQPAS